jgi:CRP-like cAMP-binding protein
MADFTPAQIAEQLQGAPLFKGVAHEDLLALIAVMKQQSFTAGTVLFEKDAPGDTMYVILSGNLRIFARDAEGHDITLTNYGAGRVFGDFAMLDGEKRSAAASAIDNLDVLALDRADFLTFLPEHPTIGLAMLRNLADRVRYITIYLSKINDFGQRLVAGEYERALQEFTAGGTDDGDIKGMISAFAKMVHSLQAREAAEKAESPTESQVAH